MKKFIERALDRLPKLDEEQIRSLIQYVSAENDLLGVVLESMTDGLVVLDSSHAVLLHNKAAERLLPFVNGDINDRFLWEVLTDRDIGVFFEESLQSQDRINDKQFTLDTGGGIRILSCSIMPLVQAGEVLGCRHGHHRCQLRRG